ncbi:CRISPR-associated endonuclease Cas1 [Dirofilaria immitis]
MRAPRNLKLILTSSNFIHYFCIWFYTGKAFQDGKVYNDYFFIFTAALKNIATLLSAIATIKAFLVANEIRSIEGDKFVEGFHLMFF